MLQNSAPPTLNTIRQIAAAGFLDPRTVKRAYTDPGTCKPIVYERVQRAALACNVPLPPPRMTP
jgi:hypothetical protein